MWIGWQVASVAQVTRTRQASSADTFKLAACFSVMLVGRSKHNVTGGGGST